MLNNITYSILIPSYHEAENLQLILPRIQQVLSTLESKSEIIVIDTTAPMDNAESLCKQHAVNNIRRSPSDTYGDAIRTGIQAARGEWIIIMDADGSHSPEFLLNLIEQTQKQTCDVVIASRYMQGGGTENNYLLVAMSKLLNYIYGTLLKVKCKDVSNSFRIYRATRLKALTLVCQNFDIVEEILIQLMQRFSDLSVCEIPYVFKKRLHGKSKRQFLQFVYSYFISLFKFIYYRFLK